MAKKPIVFKPELLTPVGINNFSGELFRCFTKGETLHFTFSFAQSGIPMDVTDWKVVIAFADKLSTDPGCDSDQNLLEVEIPLIDLANAKFDGDVLGDKTYSLPAGITYAMAKFTNADGASYIIDMAMLEVYPSVVSVTI
jgi:hypothetical protein